MKFQPDPMQTLLIWSLIYQHDGTALYKDIKPQLGAQKGVTAAQRRDQLVEAGLLEKERASRGAIQLTVTDAGWVWAQDNMNAELSERSPAANAILRAVLTHLDEFLSQRNMALAEFFMGPAPPEPEEITNEVDTIQEPARDLRTRVREYWQQVTLGRQDIKVSLAKLRQELADVAREELDTLLLAMHKSGDLVLVPLENRRLVTDADKKAAITIAGEANHVFYME